jgi:hypothetical protein
MSALCPQMNETMPLFSEEFIADGGFRLRRDQCSLLMRAQSVGAHFKRKGKAAYAKTILDYLEQVDGRPVTPRASSKPLLIGDFTNLHSPTFFRFETDAGFEYVRQGCFKFGTPGHYRSIEDAGRADHLEGYACIFIEGPRKSFNVAGMAGFNAVMLCGTAQPPRDRRTLEDRKRQFGPYLIEIHNVASFMGAIAAEIGSVRQQVKDVRYIDGKFMTIKSPELDGYIDRFGTGNLTLEAIHAINELYWEYLYENLSLPAAFTKPTRFSGERERRILFELPSDIDEPYLIVKAPEALEFIRIIQ